MNVKDLKVMLENIPDDYEIETPKNKGGIAFDIHANDKKIVFYFYGS